MKNRTQFGRKFGKHAFIKNIIIQKCKPKPCENNVHNHSHDDHPSSQFFHFRNTILQGSFITNENTKTQHNNMYFNNHSGGGDGKYNADI